MEEKKYFYSTLSMTFLLLFLVAGFNYWQDPANLFMTERDYRKYALALADGHTLAVTSNYDERLYKKSEILANPRPRDVVVLGSSRVMAFSKENLGEDLEVENLGVSGAVLQDDIIMWHIYKEANKENLPKIVIIDAAPWLFNKHSGEVRYKVLADEYYDAIRRLAPQIDIAADDERWSQLVSKKYTEASYDEWKKHIYSAKPSPLAVCDDIENRDENWALILPDGSREWPQKLYNADADKLAKAYIKDKIYHLENYDKLDVDLQEAFANLIEGLQSHNIEVVFYFAPYHPYVYDFLKEKPKYVKIFKAEQWLRNYAEKHGIKMLGSYNPSEMSLDGNDFLDGMHLKRNAFMKFSRRIE